MLLHVRRIPVARSKTATGNGMEDITTGLRRRSAISPSGQDRCPRELNGTADIKDPAIVAPTQFPAVPLAVITRFFFSDRRTFKRVQRFTAGAEGVALAEVRERCTDCRNELLVGSIEAGYTSLVDFILTEHDVLRGIGRTSNSRIAPAAAPFVRLTLWVLIYLAQLFAWVMIGYVAGGKDHYIALSLLVGLTVIASYRIGLAMHRWVSRDDVGGLGILLRAFSAARDSGNVDLARRLLAQLYPLSRVLALFSHAYQAALEEHLRDPELRKMGGFAARCGPNHMTAAQWVWNSVDPVRGRRGVLNAFLGAAAAGHLEVLVWLETQYRFSNRVYQDAALASATHGELEILQWLWARNEAVSSIGQEAALAAARSRHLHVLVWLQRKLLDDDL